MNIILSVVESLSKQCQNIRKLFGSAGIAKVSTSSEMSGSVTDSTFYAVPSNATLDYTDSDDNSLTHSPNSWSVGVEATHIRRNTFYYNGGGAKVAPVKLPRRKKRIAKDRPPSSSPSLLKSAWQESSSESEREDEVCGFKKTKCPTSLSVLKLTQHSLSSTMKLTSCKNSLECSEREVYVCVNTDNKFSTPPCLLQLTKDSWSSSPSSVKLLSSSSSDTNSCESEVCGKLNKTEVRSTSPSLFEFDQVNLSSCTSKSDTLDFSETNWTESDCEVDGQRSLTNIKYSTSPTRRASLSSLPSSAKFSLNSSRREREVRRSNSGFEEKSDPCCDCHDTSEEKILVVDSVRRKRRVHWSSSEDDIFLWERNVPIIDSASAKTERCVLKDDKKLRAGCFVYLNKISEKDVAALKGIRPVEDDGFKDGKRVYNLRKRKVADDMRGKRIVTKYRRIALQSEEE